MRSFFKDWLFLVKCAGVPLFFYLLLDFLQRNGEFTVVKDVVYSFSFLSTALVGLAVVLGLILASFSRAFGRSFIQKGAGFLSAWYAFFIFLLYFKDWLHSFTSIQNLAALDANRSRILLLALVLTTLLFLAFQKGYFSRLQDPFSQAFNRLFILVLVFSFASFGVVVFVLAKSILLPGQVSATMMADTTEKPNVLLIVVDTLSARHLSMNGYQDNKTPIFDRLATEGYFFENVRANVTSTLPSLSSLLTGRSPLKSHILSFQPVQASTTAMNLLTLLEKEGYKTASLIESEYAATSSLGLPAPTDGEMRLFHDNFVNDANQQLSKFGKSFGFTLQYRIPPISHPPLSATSSPFFDRVLEKMDGLSGSSGPFFLYAHYMLPTRFSFEEAEKTGLKYCASYAEEKQPVIDRAKIVYDRAISDLDEGLGRFMEDMKQQGSLDNTIVVITADHGDSYSGGFWGHGTDLSENTIQVPLILLTPSHKKERFSNPVQVCDIAPTILELSGIGKKPEWMDCVSVFDRTRQRPIVTFNLNTDRSVREIVPFPGLKAGRSIAFYDNGLKLIVHPEELSPDGRSPLGRSDEFFDINADPDERVNLKDTHPQKSFEMKQTLLSLLDNAL